VGCEEGGDFKNFGNPSLVHTSVELHRPLQARIPIPLQSSGVHFWLWKTDQRHEVLERGSGTHGRHNICVDVYLRMYIYVCECTCECMHAFLVPASTFMHVLSFVDESLMLDHNCIIYLKLGRTTHKSSRCSSWRSIRRQMLSIKTFSPASWFQQTRPW